MDCCRWHIELPTMHGIKHILESDTENENFVTILMKFPSLAALEIEILAISSAVSDENFIKITTFPFQWSCDLFPSLLCSIHVSLA